MKNIIPAVYKAIELVEILAASPNGMSRNELAEKLAISKTTTYRIINSLCMHKWIEKSNAGYGMYQLSSGLLPIVMTLHDEMLELDTARKVIQNIADEHHIACKISIRYGLEQYVFARAEPPGPFITTGKEGYGFTIAEGTSGACLLYEEKPSDRELIYNECNASQEVREEFEEYFRQIKKRGFCLRPKHSDWPISAMTAPIYDSNNKIVASLTFILPQGSYDEGILGTKLISFAKQCIKES
ncbi:MAG: helix-turn-helix domain-containing protein [Kiritimatiellae bacterium]|nr:helix-turn-helix domain-containing protein [Kiritimatiellia bacterium]